MWLVILINLLYAIGFPITKVALAYGSPLFLIALRMFIGSLALLILQWYIDPRQLKVPKQLVWLLFLSGLFNMYLTNFFEFYGIAHMNPAKAAFLYNLAPFIAALLGYLLLSERMTPHKWLGMLIAFTGSLLVLGTKNTGELTAIGFISWAELSLLCAATCTVYGCIIIQKLVKTGYSSIMITAIAMLFGGVMALGHSMVIEPWEPVPATNLPVFFGWVLVMVILYNFIAYELYNRLVRFYTVTFLTLSGFMTPIFTAFFDWLWFGSVMGWEFWVASILILVGLYVFYRDELGQIIAQAP